MADLNLLTRLMTSGKKADIKRAQRILKAEGKYSGNIDGIAKGGTGKAIAALRSEARADKAAAAAIQKQKLALAQSQSKANAALAQSKAAEKKRADKAKASALKIQNKKAADSSKMKDAAVQTGLVVTSIATSVLFGKGEVRKMNAFDKPAVAAKNKELKRYAGSITKIQNSKLNKTKAGTLKVAAKRQIAAIAKEAKVQGVTKFKAPIGLANGGILVAKGLMLNLAASQTDNEYLKGALNATATGLQLAGAGVPSSRFTHTRFGANPLNGAYVAKLAEGTAIGETVSKVKNTKAVKAARVTSRKATSFKVPNIAFKGVKAASKTVPFLGLAVVAYTAGHVAYNTFSKTGSAAKAASAAAYTGANELSFGVIDKLSKSKNGAEVASRRQRSNRARMHRNRSLTRSTKNNTVVKSISIPKTTKVRAQAVKTPSSNGLVKGHYRRTQGGKRVFVKGFRRAS